MRPAIKARPTVYEGVQMRSRLEAQFAQILDGFGCEWEYEPECFADKNGQYLPDFLIDCDGEPWWIEVKPFLDPGDPEAIFNRMRPILSSHPFETTPYPCNLAISSPQLGDFVFMQSWFDVDSHAAGLAVFLRSRFEGGSPTVRLQPATGWEFTCSAFDEIVAEGCGVCAVDWPYG